MKKILKILICIIMIIAITGCGTSLIEKKIITNKALNYFCNKYSFDKKDVKINHNYLYGKNEKCFNSCNENAIYINYNNKEYVIDYNEFANYFTDDYQYDEINKDLLEYLQDKFKFASKIEVKFSDIIPEKYTGNIKEYFNKIKDFYNNNKYIYGEGGQLVSEDINTWVDIWIEANNETEAKKIKNKYSEDLETELEELEVNYNIAISKNSEDNEYSAFYYYHVYDSQYYFTDNVDNENNG